MVEILRHLGIRVVIKEENLNQNEERMMKIFTVLLTLWLALLTGCAAIVTQSSPVTQPLNVSAGSEQYIVLNVTGSKVATESKDWAGFKSIWHDAMKAEVAAIGPRLTIQEGDMKISEEPGTLVVVYINDYRWVSAGARFAFGIMTGNAFVDSKVNFIDLHSGKQIGEQNYNTSSSAVQGIFAAMTDKQVAAICKEIVTKIQPR